MNLIPGKLYRLLVLRRLYKTDISHDMTNHGDLPEGEFVFYVRTGTGTGKFDSNLIFVIYKDMCGWMFCPDGLEEAEE